MNVYKYNEDTKEYIGIEAAQLDPLETKKAGKNIYLLPANATFTKPKEAEDGYVNVWDGRLWKKTEDNRGKEYWLPEDVYGTPARVMEDLGAFPDGAVFTAPEQSQEDLDKIEADRTQGELRSMAINTMMMNLADEDLTEARVNYKSKLRSVSDNIALLIPNVFPHWSGNSKEYVVDDKVLYNDILYKVLQNHTSQGGWTPEAAPSLFAKVLTSTTGEILEWEQPSSTNPYMKGDKVKFNGKIYESLIDNNVWSPEGYPAGWKEIEEA